MKFFTHDITVGGVTVPLRCYIPDVCGRTSYAGKRPAVVVFPGGGYSFTYHGEAEPIALKYAADGVCSFVLDYSCAPVRFPIPQLEAFAAVRYVRENAEEFGLNPHNVSTLGFSAGGHLCACTGTLWNKPGFTRYFAEYGLSEENADTSVFRPDKLILCYPVIKATSASAHRGSILNLLGPEGVKDEELLTLVSTEKQIDDRTPPAFLWHGVDDTGVPMRNSLEFALGLADRRIPAELHTYRHCGHGLCLGTCVTNECTFKEPAEAAEWMEKSIAFVYDEEILPQA